MKSFKQHMLYEESTEVSTALETVLGVAYESVSKGKPKILKDAMADDGNFKKAKKYLYLKIYIYNYYCGGSVIGNTLPFQGRDIGSTPVLRSNFWPAWLFND